MMRRKEKLVIALIVCMHLISFFSIRNGIKDIFVPSPSCKLPCWIGITPGVTSKQEFTNIIDSSPNIKKEQRIFFTFYQDFLKTLEIKVKFQPLKPRIHMDAMFYKDKVATIDIYQNIDITLGEIINEFGTPESVLIDGYAPHVSRANLNLYYPSKGIIFSLPYKNIDSKCSPKDKVTNIMIYDPNIFQLLITRGMITQIHDGKPENNFMPWSGYGIIREKYWNP